ncbi:hypothetical protein L3X38_036107 [Prunus dulcis]|uniref:Uncharacterized protein n=1 Tax=Prunus dulcis TaxID=3755 RepID=A0AAD4V0S9_PRUDU|nr:hypothetical protein L3X38_036107 [Prunus dulcis]
MINLQVQSELEEDNHGVSENLRWLAAGPNMAVPLYRSYLIKGITFNIKAQDDVRTTQNSGVYLLAHTMQVASAKDKNPILSNMGFYGVIQEIWDLDYQKFTIPVFREYNDVIGDEVLGDVIIECEPFTRGMPNVDTFDELVGELGGRNIRVVIAKTDLIKYMLTRSIIRGRIGKWTMALAEFTFHYVPQLAVKGQALVDFLAAHPCFELEDMDYFPVNTLSLFPWHLYFDESRTSNMGGAGIIIESPQGFDHRVGDRERTRNKQCRDPWDSMLVLKQLSGDYKANAMAPLASGVQIYEGLLEELFKVEKRWISLEVMVLTVTLEDSILRDKG